MFEGKIAAAQSGSDQLFTALAEQLKLPLLQIARLAELGEPTDLSHIAVISSQAMRLVDAYVQSQSQSNQATLILEPVAASAVLYDVAQDLQPFARHYNIELELDRKGGSGPVLAHRQLLKTVLSLIASSLIESMGSEKTEHKRVVLATHGSSKGTVVGAFCGDHDTSERAMRLTRQLQGDGKHSGTPMFGTSGAAALAIANQLTDQLNGSLKAYRHRSLLGVGTLLLPSRQLQLLT